MAVPFLSRFLNTTMATPRKLKSLNLSVAGSTVQIDKDLELDDKENQRSNKDHSKGKDLYSFKRSQNKLHKYIPKTPFVERENKRLKAQDEIEQDSR